MNKFLKKRIIRYIISGGLSFAIENISFLVAYYTIGLAAVYSSVSSIIVALLFNFLLTRIFVFSGGEYEKHGATQFGLYIAVICVNLLSSTGIVVVLINIGLKGYLAKLIATLVVSAWTYFIYKNVIFKTTAQS